ncbi:MAG: hypothetical protein ACRD27_02135, partial [Terracidiphilus sp.]
DEGQPVYALEAKFDGLSAPEMGKLLDMRWSGGPFGAEGKIQLAGLTAHDLAASAAGTLHFDWRRGAVVGLRAAAKAARDEAKPGDKGLVAAKAEPVPPALTRFFSFTGNAEIRNGTVTLSHAEAREGARRRPVEGDVTLADPPRVTLAAPREMLATKRQNGRPVQ